MIYMDRKSKTIRGTLIAIAIICLISTIGSTYAKYSRPKGSQGMSDSISKIKTIISTTIKK